MTRHRALLVLHLAGMAAILAPVIANPLPPLADFPAVIARMTVLHAAAGDPALAANYEVHWGFTPYLGTDLLFGPLLKLMSPVDAGRLLLGVSLVLTAIAPAVLHRVLSGGFSPWPLLAYPLAYHHLLFWSALNFNLALGPLILAFTAWIASGPEPSWRRAAIFSTLAFLLLTIHLFAWACFVLLIAGTLWRPSLARVAETAVTAVVPLVLWKSLPAPRPGHGDLLQLDEIRWGTWAERVRDLASPFNFDFLPTDIALTAAGGVFLYWLIRQRPAELDRRLLGPLVLVALTIPAMPHLLFGAWGSMRLPLLFLLLLIGATRPVRLERRSAVVLAGVATALFAAKSWQIEREWSRCQPVISEVRQALGSIERGSSLASALGDDLPACLRRPAFSHLAAYAVIDRSAYSPQVLALSTVFPAARRLALARLSGPVPFEPERLDAPTLTAIRAEADYLLTIDRSLDARLPAEGFRPVVSGSYFTLFRTIAP